METSSGGRSNKLCPVTISTTARPASDSRQERSEEVVHCSVPSRPAVPALLCCMCCVDVFAVSHPSVCCVVLPRYAANSNRVPNAPSLQHEQPAPQNSPLLHYYRTPPPLEPTTAGVRMSESRCCQAHQSWSRPTSQLCVRTTCFTSFFLTPSSRDYLLKPSCSRLCTTVLIAWLVLSDPLILWTTFQDQRRQC